MIRNQIITINLFSSSMCGQCKVYYHFTGMPHLSSCFLCPRCPSALSVNWDIGMLVSTTSTSKLVKSTYTSVQDLNALWNTSHQPWLTTSPATCSVYLWSWQAFWLHDTQPQHQVKPQENYINLDEKKISQWVLARECFNSIAAMLWSVSP